MQRALTPRNGLFAILTIAILGTLAMAAVVMAGGNDDDDRTPPSDDVGKPDVDPNLDLEQVLAPIDDVDLAVAESDPVQYILTVVSGQPGGCHEFDDYKVERDGNKVIVTVTNSVPKNLSAMLCTAEYRTTTSNINLGSDFETGESYTIEVNGEVAEEFVAQ